MNLQTFVKETLIQLAKGIREAQGALQDTGAMIAPREVWTPDASSHAIVFSAPRKSNDVGRPISMVEFDVSVTVEEKKGKGAEIRVGSGSIGFGIFGRKSLTDQTTSRVKFTVPVALPAEGETTG